MMYINPKKVNEEYERDNLTHFSFLFMFIQFKERSPPFLDLYSRKSRRMENEF